MGEEGKEDKCKRREETTSLGSRDTFQWRIKASWDTSSVRTADTSRSRSRRRRSTERGSGRSRGGQRARSGTSWAGREQVKMISTDKSYNT